MFGRLPALHNLLLLLCSSSPQKKDLRLVDPIATTAPTMALTGNEQHEPRRQQQGQDDLVHSSGEWTSVKIDYSAANEYIAAHYGRPSPVPLATAAPPTLVSPSAAYSSGGDAATAAADSSSLYFSKNSKIEKIYNARTITTTFASHGFSLLRDSKFQMECLPAVEDWRNLSSVRELYLPHVEHALRTVLFRDTPIAHVVFWCPTLRTGTTTTSSSSNTTITGSSSRPCTKPTTMSASTSNHTTISTPHGNYVATAHIDTDVNAYQSVRDLVRMIVKNQLLLEGIGPTTAAKGTAMTTNEQEQRSISNNNINNNTSVDEDEIVTAIERHGRRFAIVNAWKNIGESPVSTNHAPLAFMPARYMGTNTAFPRGSLDEPSCRWYTFPSMTPEELLLFAQYDRDAAYSSDLWHCALLSSSSSLLADKGGSRQEQVNSSRQSFDIRCFVLFADTVAAARDRLNKRLPSHLDLPGSAAFCADQSRRRRRRLEVSE